MSKIHPKEETYPLQRRFFGCKITQKKRHTQERTSFLAIFLVSVIGRWMLLTADF